MTQIQHVLIEPLTNIKFILIILETYIYQCGLQSKEAVCLCKLVKHNSAYVVFLEYSTTWYGRDRYLGIKPKTTCLYY